MASSPIVPSSFPRAFWGAVVPQGAFVANNPGQGKPQPPDRSRGEDLEKLFNHFPLPPAAVLDVNC